MLALIRPLYLYRDSAWLFIGGLPYELTEGDVLSVFSQYGEIVHINLIRDHVTGKSKGFGFICFEDQRSTVLTVDNLNGIKLCKRTIRVDHVETYKLPKDLEKLDADRKKLFLEGCAPKPIEQDAGEDEDDGLLPLEGVREKDKKSKKKKKEKKAKKKKKKKKRGSSSSESSDSSDSEEDRVKKEPESPKRDDRTYRRRSPSPRRDERRRSRERSPKRERKRSRSTDRERKRSRSRDGERKRSRSRDRRREPRAPDRGSSRLDDRGRRDRSRSRERSHRR